MSKTFITRKLNEFSFFFNVKKSGKMSSIEQGSMIQNYDVTFSGKYSLKSVVKFSQGLPLVQVSVELHIHW
jgi:hypothetical protein